MNQVKIHDLSAYVFQLKRLETPPLLLQNVLDEAPSRQLGLVHRVVVRFVKRQLWQPDNIRADVAEAAGCPTISFVFQIFIGGARDDEPAPRYTRRT